MVYFFQKLHRTSC